MGAATGVVGWMAGAVRVRVAETVGATGLAEEEVVASGGIGGQGCWWVGWVAWRSRRSRSRRTAEAVAAEAVGGAK